ncbi:hypothetical protein ES703_60723 [subsurface metagenome]
MLKAHNGIADIVKIVAEKDGVNFRTGACRPAKVCSRVYKAGAVRQVVVIGLLGWNCKAPDVTFVYRSTVGLNLINPPVVSCARHQTVRNGKSGKTNSEKRLSLVALECAAGAIAYIGKILAEIYIV